jgi:hypothetical protein
LAIAKYGIENFTKEILHIFDNEADMNAKEKELVVINEQTYNLIEGGHGGFGYINRNRLTSGITNINSRKNLLLGTGMKNLTESQLAAAYNKTSLTMRRMYKEGILKPRITKHTVEFKTYIGKLSSVSQSGHRNSQYGTCWITNGIENKKIKKTDHIPDGYIKGRDMNLRRLL